MSSRSTNRAKVTSQVFFALTLCFFLFPLSYAADEYLEYFPTTFLDVGMSYQTHKSASLESNDVASATLYSIGMNAGEERVLGVIFKNETAAVKYALNESAFTAAWQDIIIRYRWYGWYMGAVIGSGTALINQAGTDIAELSASGYGFNFGGIIPMRKGKWFMDLTSVTYGVVTDVNQQTFSLGPKMDFMSGLGFELTRSIDFIWALQFKTLATDAGAGGTDTMHGIYFGVSMGSSF